jgi:hypothetical protein
MTDMSDRLPLLARAGYAARGFIYLVVGGLAALAAWGSGGRTTDGKGALTELLGAPFGKVLLGAVAVGLVCYSAWRAAQALLDADHHGTDFKGLAVRAGLGVSAVIHVGLAVFAVSLIMGRAGAGSESGDQSSQEWTAWLMSQPMGQWLVGLVGITIGVVGIAHLVKAWRARFARRFAMGPDERRVIMPVSRFGLSARGVVFLIIGGFLVLAAVQQDPDQARGLSGALRSLQDQPYGWVLLAVVALGLMMFGAYSIIESIYRRIEVPSELR